MTSPSQQRPVFRLLGLERPGGVLGAVLVLNGASRSELERASALAAMLADRCLLIAVDGGLKTCMAADRRPDLLVGDGDSSRGLPREAPVVALAEEKDCSDLAAALDEARKRRVQFATVAGLLGGRLDHEWANLFEVGRAATRFAALMAPSSRGMVVVTRRGCDAATVPRRLFSLFALGGAATVSLRGSRWELQRRRIQPGSAGLSNLTGTELELRVHHGVAGLVFPPARRRYRPRAPASADGFR